MEDEVEALKKKLDETRTELNNLIVAVRGGGDLGGAADQAQAFLDKKDEQPADEGDADGEAAKESETAAE